MMEINGFFKEFRFLSNFWPVNVTYGDIDFPSVEHAYQALKTTDHSERERIATLRTAKEAKAAGYKVELRKHWDMVRVPLMKILLDKKFSDPDLKRALIMTYPIYLEETNRWGDAFWGVFNGEGENHLGRLLMEIREDLVRGGHL